MICIYLDAESYTIWGVCMRKEMWDVCVCVCAQESSTFDRRESTSTQSNHLHLECAVSMCIGVHLRASVLTYARESHISFESEFLLSLCRIMRKNLLHTRIFIRLLLDAIRYNSNAA